MKHPYAETLVPTLCVGTHGGDALRRVSFGAAAPGFGTQSVQMRTPTQSVGARVFYKATPRPFGSLRR